MSDEQLVALMICLFRVAEKIDHTSHAQSISEHADNAHEILRYSKNTYGGITTYSSDYSILVSAIEENLAVCITEDDIAQVAIYEKAITSAGTALAVADDTLHVIRAALARDLARKYNRYLDAVIQLIDRAWEDSSVLDRLHEARIARHQPEPFIDAP